MARSGSPFRLPGPRSHWVRGAADGWYPYPFLDPATGGYGQVVVTVVAITLGFLVISAITVAVGNRNKA